MSNEIAEAVQRLRVLMDLLKAKKSLAHFNELVAAVSEVTAQSLSTQGVVLAAQKHSTLSDRIRELEKEILELKSWEREADRYQLTELSPGLFTYYLKPGREQGEPIHHLCTNCFAQREKSILQIRTSSSHRRYECPRCQQVLHPGARKRGLLIPRQTG